MKKALITGVTGQDGSYLSEFLIEKGYDVHGIIRRSSVDYRERIAHLEGNPHFHLHYGDMGDSHVGLQARLMSQALRKLTPVVSKSNCIVIFINQLREKVGVMFGNPETTTGGRALKFYSSVRMDVRRIETLKQGGEVIGNRTRVKVVKNKVAPPFKEAEFDIMFGKGISVEGDILDLAVSIGLVQKSGAWFAYNNEKIGQGRENAKNYLAEHPEIMEELDKKVREHYFSKDNEESAENAEQSTSEDAKGAPAKKKAAAKEE